MRRKPSTRIVSDDVCTYCGLDKKSTLDQIITKEHVFSQSFLEEFGIWEADLTLLNGVPTKYRSITFPACGSCNNVFGSQFENEIIKILRSPKKLPRWLFQSDLGFSIKRSSQAVDVDDRLALWMHKLLFGTLYYESTLVNYRNRENQPDLGLMRNHLLFKWLCKAFSDHEKPFLASIAFRLNKRSDHFDYRTLNAYGLRLANLNISGAEIISNNGSSPVVAVKIPGLLLIAVIADGCLVQTKFHQEFHKKMRNYLSRSRDPFAYEEAIAWVLAMSLNLRLLPGRPKWIESNGQLTNMSLSTMASVEYINTLESRFAQKINEDFLALMNRRRTPEVLR